MLLALLCCMNCCSHSVWVVSWSDHRELNESHKGRSGVGEALRCVPHQPQGHIHAGVNDRSRYRSHRFSPVLVLHGSLIYAACESLLRIPGEKSGYSLARSHGRSVCTVLHFN